MRFRLSLSVMIAFVGGFQISTLAAQATDPPYLRDFPSVDRVKQAMQVSDPKETALRQVGALWQLQEILKQLSGRREFRGFTPGEGKLIGEYGVAEYYTAQAADSAFPGPYGRLRKLTDSTPYRYARTDPRFGVEGIEVFKRLLTPAIQNQYDQLAGIDRARIEARSRADAEATARGGYVVAGQAQPAQSESQKQMQRCIESGRKEGDCLSEGISGSFRELLGGFLPSDLLSAKTVGLRLVGNWPGSGKFGLDFALDNASIHCSDLIPVSVEYTVTQTANGLRVTLALPQAPMTFAVRQPATLLGPAAADITGQIIVGYQSGVRTYSDGRQEPISRPIYDDATRRCSIGALTVSSPTTSLGGIGNTNPMLDLLAGGLNRLTQQIPTGLRMTGRFRGGTGLDIDFLLDGAVVSCGDVGILRPYRVQLQGGQVVITVENGSAPFTMTLGVDGTLSGSGTIRVDGRKITGSGPAGLTYVPRTASCPLERLAPVGGPS